MAIITNKYWHGEPIKVVIKFNGVVVYTAYTKTPTNTDANWINKSTFSFSEGNNSVTPLGVATSNKATLEIYDAGDNLSPANTNGIYYGKCVNGVEFDIFRTYDGVNYVPYGTWYATAWSGSFGGGWHNVAKISLEDKLNTLGNYDLPQLPATANVDAGDLIVSVLTGIGVTSGQYTIDPAINKTLPYGIAQGGKVRDFFNNICQLLLARVIIDRSGIIKFVPSQTYYSDCNEITLGPADTGQFQNKNTNNVNYNAINVKYLVAGDTKEGNIFSDTGHSLVVGTNTINDITFKANALDIEIVDCLVSSANNTASVDSMQFTGYMNGIALSIVLSGENTTNCTLTGEGTVVSTTSGVATASIDNASIVGGLPFVFDSKQMMTLAEAQVIANGLASYISMVSRVIVMQGSALTPMLYVGDKVTVAGTNTMYDGVYKIIGIDIVDTQAYSLSFTLIRVA